MKVRIVEWCEYIPDCPADYEAFDATTIAVLAVDGIEDIATRGAIELYRRDRIQEDYEGQTSWAFDHAEKRGQPMSEKEKAEALAYAAEERDEAQADFEEFYRGFFNHNDYEVGKYLPYVHEEDPTHGHARERQGSS